MLEPLRRWWFRWRWPASWVAAQRWAHEQGWHFKPGHAGEGFVIEPGPDPHWRLEWGPSHRRYLGGHELRFRGDTSLDPDSFAVVMPRGLLEGLQRELFSSFTESVQTRVDESLPSEVRWLAMGERLSGQSLGELREWVGAVGNDRPWLKAWLAGPTGRMLTELLAGRGSAATPMSLSIHEGQLTLRVGLASPDVAALGLWMRFFELALDQASRCGTLPVDSVNGPL